MQTKQRGSGWSIALVFNLYKIFGYNFIYYLMYPVSFFYFIFAKNVKESLKIYYKNIGIKFTNRVYFEHLRIFAICMVDRFIAKVDHKNYSFLYTDISKAKKTLNEGTVLLYSHFGGWAASSNFSPVKNRLNIVMKESLLEGIKKIEDSLEIRSDINIIDLKESTLQVSIQIANALINSEIVAIMADRPTNKKAKIAVDFLGKKAYFNKNPFQIAYKSKKPILVYFVILKDKQKYKIEHSVINLDQTKNEKEAIEIAINEYIKKYEKIIKEYPNQWFNFYDFWGV